MGQEAADIAQVREAGGLVQGAHRKDSGKGPSLGCILGCAQSLAGGWDVGCEREWAQG